MWRVGPSLAFAIIALAAIAASWHVEPDESPPRPATVVRPDPVSTSQPAVAEPASPAEALWPEVHDFEFVSRPLHRPRKYTVPPPGGRYQLLAVQAARDKRCSEALDTVRSAVEISVDYATLFRSAWLCFVDRDGRPLRKHPQVAELRELTPVLLHLEGSPLDVEMIEAQLPEGRSLEDVPVWARPPAGGLEYRLQAFLLDPLMQDIAVDQLGPARIADHLAWTVHAELRLAQGLSARLPAAGVADLLARRVLWAPRALRSPLLANLLQEHRPQDFERLLRVLDEVAGPDSPPAVQLARQLGERP